MSTVESITVPAERIPPVAREASEASKTVAAVLFFAVGVLVLAMFGVAERDDEKADDAAVESAAERSGRKVGRAIAPLLFIGIPAIFAVRAARNASRATRARTQGASDRNMTWRLSGRLLVAADATGSPRPDMTFKVTRRLRTMLLALPRNDASGGG